MVGKARQGLILDNGAYNIKIGLQSSINSISIPNAVMRTSSSNKVYIGDEIISSNTDSYASAKWWKRPTDRGIVVNWELEQKIWDISFHRVFQTYNSSTYNIDDLSFEDFSLLYTQPPLCPPMLQNVSQEVIFELYGFNNIYRCTPASLVLYNENSNSKSNISPCSIVIDSGYSFTHIMPFIGNKLIHEGIKRINIGGKMMDNYLKELISFRQWNVMEETYLISCIKEQLCYVSLDFISELEKVKNNTFDNTKYWVLPSTKGDIGHIRNDNTPKNAQMIRMINEQFSIPELLFNPSIIGGQQCGIVESIIHCVNSCPEEMREALYSNIILSGGNVNFRNFKERIEKELRTYIPQEYKLNISIVQDPITAAWNGGKLLQNSEQYENMYVTKDQYLESGNIITNLFNN